MSAVPDKRSARRARAEQVPESLPPARDETSEAPPPRDERRRNPGLRRMSDIARLDWTSAGMSLVTRHRTHGHLKAQLDPLGTPPPGDPALEPESFGLTPEAMEAVPAAMLRVYVPGDTLAEVLPQLRRVYCGTIAYELEHLSSHEERWWLREAIESRRYWVDASPEEERRLLVRLLRVEGLEQYLRRTFLGAKQFSIEGLEMMVLMLDEAIALAAEEGIEQAVFGMAHRGRLNVLAHVLRRPYAKIIAEFEGERTTDVETDLPEGGAGDVKYHLGATSTRRIPVDGGEREIRLSLLPNPSHLEFVNPVVVGRTRALQTEHAGESAIEVDAKRAMAVQIHGDAAFSGQGVVAETLNLQGLPGYRVGGSLHLIANNQVGFTTDAVDARSTRYSSDMAKGFDVPIIHVNADDLRACRTAIRLAMAFRRRFGRDVVIDLVGYRRWGHNEGDEPAYTQPTMYDAIREKPSVASVTAERLVRAGIVSEDDVAEMRAHIARRLQEAHQSLKAPRPVRERPVRASDMPQPAVETAVPADVLRALNEELLTLPDGFMPHPKLAQQLERRREALDRGAIDFGHAEALAFASLLREGTAVRLTGQDSERGTFSHRHAVLHDVERGRTYTPLEHVRGAQAGFEIRNSPLSETGCLGFEYGYAVTAPDALVLWEAQFGDFVNGAQVIVDQFIASGASKWGQRSRLTLLLPHGFEGNGPEHSSARLERFLQLAAEDNIRICYPTTAAQFFHLLREQARTSVRRPLVVMTPKGLLRARDAASTLDELTRTTGFQQVIDDPQARDYPEDIARLVLCSGKIYYDLQRHPERSVADEVAIARVERLYPFPLEAVRDLIASYPNLESVVWVQEEPQNAGAYRNLRHRLEASLPPGLVLEYAGRPWRSSPAEGYTVAHTQEQDRIMRRALWLDL